MTKNKIDTKTPRLKFYKTRLLELAPKHLEILLNRAKNHPNEYVTFLKDNKEFYIKSFYTNIKKENLKEKLREAEEKIIKKNKIPNKE